MALPHTIIELLDKAKLVGNDRVVYEERIFSILQKIRDKAYNEGKAAGIAEGMDTCFDLMAVEESEKDDKLNVSGMAG